MRFRMLLVATALAVAFVVAAPGTASANLVWCAGDPPVQLKTPGGQYLVVNNYLYISPIYRHQAQLVTADGYAVPDGKGGSLLTIHVHVPPGLAHLYVVSAQQRYQVTSSGDGEGGSDITMTLDVPES